MRGVTIALVGADGAGKSTVSRRMAEELDHPAVRIYMGVNLEEANIALPTTRLWLKRKRRQGQRPDMAGWHDQPGPQHRVTVRDTARVLNLIAEEWYRAAFAAYHLVRGRVVVMDRHFIADYWHHDVFPADPGRRSWVSRLHGHLLARWYPRPDHVVFLDASPEVMHARSPDTPLDYLHRRRREYISLEGSQPEFTIVPAEQPLDEVVRQCLDLAEKTLASGAGSAAGVRRRRNVP